VCELSTLAAGASLVGAGMGAAGAMQQGRYEAQVAQNNAALARAQAADAEQRGSEAAGQIEAEGHRIAGRQLTALAANNVDTTTGSAANMFSTTAMLAAADAERARVNARREAWGYRNAALEDDARARLAKRQGILTGVGALVGGLGSMAQLGARRT